MKDVLIGIDAGTSVIKSIAFDLAGNQISTASVKNEYRLTQDGGAEQDAALTWQNTASTLRSLCDSIPGLASRVAAIAVTGQGDGTWMIDGHGKPVGQALLWLDARAADIASTLSQHDDDKLRFASTGTGLNGCQQGPQLRWLLENRPEQLAKATTSFHCKDWLYYCLTGEVATDPSEGIFSFGDFRTREYSDDVLSALGLEQYRSLLPGVIEGTSIAQALSNSAASDTSLLVGTPVVLGYVDVICTALGAGLYHPTREVGVTIVGSTGMHMLLKRGADNLALNDDRTGYSMCMPIPGVYAQMQSNMAASLNIDWLLDMAADLLKRLGVTKSRDELLGILDNCVDAASPGVVLYQPYISEAGERGPFIDTNARAGFIGLSVQHGFDNLARSIFEGLSFAARDCYQAMGELPSDVVLSGGASKSKQLLHILASTLDAQLLTSQRAEAGAAGAAMMAAVSIGHYATMDDCVNEWVAPLLSDAANPDSDLVRCYHSLYPVYQQSRESLQPVWQSHATWRTTEHA